MLWRWGKLDFKSTWHYCGESKEQLCSWLPADLTCFKWSWRYFMLQDWSLLSTMCFIKLDADCSRHNLCWLETQSAALAPDHCVQTELGRELRVWRGLHRPREKWPLSIWSDAQLTLVTLLPCRSPLPGGSAGTGNSASHTPKSSPKSHVHPNAAGNPSTSLGTKASKRPADGKEGSERNSPKQIKPFQGLFKC